MRAFQRTRLTKSPHPNPSPGGRGGLKIVPFAPAGLHLSPFALWEKGRDEGILHECPNLNFIRLDVIHLTRIQSM